MSGWELGEVRLRPPADGATFHLAASGDGRWLASVGTGDVVRIWDLRNGKLVREVPGLDGVVALAFTVDGATLALSDASGVVRVDVATGAVLAPVELTDMPHGLGYAPDGRLLAVGCSDGVLRLVDDTVVAAELDGHQAEIFGVAYAPDGSLLATGADDGTVRIWDPATNQTTHELAIDGTPYHVAFSPSGAHLLAAGDDTVWIWRSVDGEQVAELSVDGLHTAEFSGDGTRLIVASADVVSLWETDDYTELDKELRFDGEVWAVAEVPTAGVFATGTSADAVIRLFEEDAGEPAGQFGGQTRTAWSLAFAPDGGRLAAATDDGDPVRVWDTATGALAAKLTGHSGPAYAVAFSPDGQQVATGDDSAVRLWDVATGQVVSELGDGEAVLSLAYSPDGKHLATGGYDGRLLLWDLASGTSRSLVAHQGPVWLVEFAADSAALTSADQLTVRRWNPATGKVVATIGGMGGEIHAAATKEHPGGGLIAISSGVSGSERFRVYDTSRVILADEETDGPAFALAFSADGTELALAGDSQDVSFWDVADSDVNEPGLTGHTGLVRAVAFSPDGRFVAVGERNGAIRLWDARTRELVAILVAFDDGGGVALRADGPSTPDGAADGEYWTKSS